MATEITNNVPVHVSLIMEGNGRWAKERGKERVHLHDKISMYFEDYL